MPGCRCRELGDGINILTHSSGVCAVVLRRRHVAIVVAQARLQIVPSRRACLLELHQIARIRQRIAIIGRGSRDTQRVASPLQRERRGIGIVEDVPLPRFERRGIAAHIDDFTCKFARLCPTGNGAKHSEK